MIDDILDGYFELWSSRILAAAAITACVWGMHACYKAGVREMENEPPQVVVDKSHTVSSYSCGQNCITNSDNWTLLSEGGDTCDVSRREYAAVKIGDNFKCTQLFGWSQH